MKKFKPNLRKMFSFHTIILVVVIIFVLRLQQIEGKLQIKHNHHNHNQHYNNNYNDDDVKQEKEHHPHQSHHESHHQHHDHLQQNQPQITTPSIEFTTSSSSSSSAAVNSDNGFLIKQHFVAKDDISKTKNYKSAIQSSSLHHHHYNLTKPNSSRDASSTLSNSILEHTHHNRYNRFVPTPSPSSHLPTFLTTHRSDIGNQRLNMATKYTHPSESSKQHNLVAEDQQQPQQHFQQQQHHRYNSKQEYDDEQQQQQRQNDEDYYEDYNNDDGSDVVDGDDDDEQEEDDIDGISDEDDSNLSDRSYARITRSKLDDDYADDEPYNNGINDHQMQRDATPGVLTEQKYLEVGNEKAVQQARERYIQEQKRPRTPHELAAEHWHRMIQATKCRKPLPRVIPVSNNTSKRYEPYATILHRCGEDTGCCGSTASVCTVKRYEIVMVYVFSYDFNYRKEIEALPMHNHTECHCVNRASLLHDFMPRDKRSGGGGGYVHHFQRLQKQPHSQHPAANNNNSNNHQQQHQLKLQNMLGCHCPRHFNVFEEDVERHAHLPRPHSVFTRKCRCDCLINNQTCLRFKHGEEGFSLEDRKCILEHNCKAPVCSNGDYNLRIGRCPSNRSHLLHSF